MRPCAAACVRTSVRMTTGRQPSSEAWTRPCGGETLLGLRLEADLHYAPNTAANRAHLLARRPGDAPARRTVKPLAPAADPVSHARTLYEHYIGLITPIVADELAEAERSYPAEWLNDAFAQAAERGKRNWNYVQAILRGWAGGGRR